MDNIIYKFNCSNCGVKDLGVGDRKIYPKAKRIDSYLNDELAFYAECPICYHLNEINMHEIPDKVKLKLMREYSGIADEVIKLKELELQKMKINQEINILKYKISKKIEDRKDNTNSLYDHWKSNEEIIKEDYVKEDPKQFKRIKKK